MVVKIVVFTSGSLEGIWVNGSRINGQIRDLKVMILQRFCYIELYHKLKTHLLLQMGFKIVVSNAYPLMEALKYSLFIRAMFSKDIPLGHSISQAPVLVQFPKPSKSIWRTMFCTRSTASTWPCGRRAN